MSNTVLIVLDGWGYSDKTGGNAVSLANTPNLDKICSDYPWALLDAAGEAVGLPPGQMGNSEVGHLNLGAGRIVHQELTRISKSIQAGDFFKNQVLSEAMDRARENRAALHLAGLVSDGGVHSHLEHLIALLDMAVNRDLERVYIHAILDGRDTVPYGARPYLQRLVDYEKKHGCCRLATVSGRYYAMDRDNRWDRVEKAYRAIVYGEGLQAKGAVEALTGAYDRGEADEFVRPTVIVDSAGSPLAKLQSGDSMIFFNFRPDRARQITRAIAGRNFDRFNRGLNPPGPYLVTMTEYDRNLPLPVAFTLEDLNSTLGEVYSLQNLQQVRIAETEKYAHVTFFFSGGREKPFTGEDRILVPSPQVATYDLQPEMSAPQVTEEIIRVLKESRHSLVVANYANMDMVGHTGILGAAIKAVEAVDRSLGDIVSEALPLDWRVLLVGDHGNAEEMLDSEGAVLTAHTANPVPFVVAGEKGLGLKKKGILADVAPTILELAGIPAPPEMTGQSMLTGGD